MKLTGGLSNRRSIGNLKGSTIRPTAAKTRQALFNILGNRTPEANFLDLFAGTGLIGLEALSRGANSLTAIEIDYKTAKAIEQRLDHLGFTGKVIRADVRKVLSAFQGSQFDIIFADPPYKSQLPSITLELIEKYDLLDKTGILIIEHTKEYRLDVQTTQLVQTDKRDYGKTSLSFFRRI